MSDRFENREAVAAKIDWEGGMDSALEYGIDEGDMPEGDMELIDAWRTMRKAWELYSSLAGRVQDLLPDSGW